jgi:hypothetical protein
MRQFNCMEDMRFGGAPDAVVAHQEKMIDIWRESDSSNLFIDWNLEVGGYTYLIETSEDLQGALEHILKDDNGQYIFDGLEAFGDGQWLHFFSITNDAGGPCYYCPIHLAQEVGQIKQ